jgi:choline kinase
MARPKPTKNLSVVIPAAGIGRRMKSYGPKPLIDLDGRRTVLSRQLEIITRVYPLADIVVVVGYEAETVIRTIPDGIKVVENELFADTNVVRSIGMGLRVVAHRNVLVVYGDLVFSAETISNVTRSGSAVVIDTQGQFREDEVGVNIVDGRATHFGYGITTKWAQIAYLTGRELEIFSRAAWNVDFRRLMGFEILNTVVDAGGKLKVIEPRGMRIVEIDSSKDIERAKKIQ